MPYKFEVFWTQNHSIDTLRGLYTDESLRVVDEKSAKRQIALLLKREGVSNIGVANMSDKFTVSWSVQIPFGEEMVGGHWMDENRRFDSIGTANKMASALQTKKNIINICIKPTLVFEEERNDWAVKYFQMARLMYATEKKVILMETWSN